MIIVLEYNIYISVHFLFVFFLLLNLTYAGNIILFSCFNCDAMMYFLQWTLNL